MDAHALDNLSGKTVLVTGAGGSIGTALCELIATRARKLILVSISESGLFRVSRMLERAPCEVVPVLGDCGDSKMMTSVLQNVDIVIHAAAHKHVHLCEQNPLAAILNNVWSTQKLMNAAQIAGVPQFCLISTDKAVEPTSIMGATKRAVELMAVRRDWDKMAVSVVRLVNILNTDGSVVPIWREQIANGGPVTITDRRCTRYFMTVADACRTVINVIYMNGRGLFMYNCGEPMRIEELANRMILNSGQEGIEIKEIGLRPGEKIDEELVIGGHTEPTKHRDIVKVIEDGKLQPSHQYIPDLIEHARCRRTADAIDVLWRVVNEAVGK